MRLTLQLLGLELDITFGPAVEAEVEGNDSGYTAASFVGFAPLDVPDFIPGVDRNNGWGDEGN